MIIPNRGHLVTLHSGLRYSSHGRLVRIRNGVAREYVFAQYRYSEFSNRHMTVIPF